jgi:hypothetical protein
LKIRNPRGSDIEWSNPCGDQVTHFIGYIERPDVENSSYNCKKTRTTFDARLIICVSFANEGKTKIGWVAVIGRKTQRWAKTNNIPPNGSTCH